SRQIEVLQYGQSRVFCGKLTSALQVGSNSLFVTSDGHLIAYGLTHADYDIWKSLKDELVSKGQSECVLDFDHPRIEIKEECAFLGGSSNFGHFVFEYLSRLAVLASFRGGRELKLAVYDDLPTRYLEFLARAGYEGSRLMLVPREKSMKFLN